MTISSGIDRYSNNYTTTLNGGINSSVTSIVVNSAVGSPNPGPFRIIIDTEQMQVTGGYGTTTFTVVRGTDGTTAASHSNSAVVSNNITAFDYHSYRSEWNPLSYGAIGDGSADDSTPFQNAINDAHAMANGGHVYIPDLPFKINSTLTGYANVVFVTHGAVITGTGAASVTPLIKFSQLGDLSLPGALTVFGGAIIGGWTTINNNLTVAGTTQFNYIAYTWPGSAGTSGQSLTTNGSGGLSWTTSGGAPVSSVSGTGGQVTVSPTTGAVVVSLPSGGTLPGAWTGASGFTITTGGLTVSAGGITVSSGGANIVGGITGTLSTAAQPNITSLGTLTSITVSGSTTFNSRALSWPSGAGANGQVLTTNGSGGLSWTNVAGAVSSVSGTTGQVTVSPTTGAAVVSLYTNGTLPGTWTANSLFTATGGLSVSDNASNTVPTLPSSNGTQIWIQVSDPGASAGEGDFWMDG